MAGAVGWLHAEHRTPPLQHPLGMVENRDDHIAKIAIENTLKIVDCC